MKIILCEECHQKKERASLGKRKLCEECFGKILSEGLIDLFFAGAEIMDYKKVDWKN